MNLPKITHLQFHVLTSLHDAGHPGRDLRQRLAEVGMRRSGPAFYQLMSRLEDAGLVDGRYEQKIVDGQIIKERHYTITEKGLEAWQATRDFYVEAISSAERTTHVGEA